MQADLKNEERRIDPGDWTGDVSQAQSSPDYSVLSWREYHSWCRLSAGAQVKAALWILLEAREGLLH